MKIISHSGPCPEVRVPGQVDAKQVLRIMERQLQVLEALTEVHVFVERGTRVELVYVTKVEEKSD